MSMVINTNTASLVAQAAQAKTSSAMDQAMERLSTGKRINTAADDAAGLAISTRMESQIRGIQMAMKNAGDGQALIDTTEGAMDEVSNILQRMRELSVQASNDTNVAGDRLNLQAEMNQLVDEINRISSQTTWNGMSVLDGTFTQKTLQIGAEANQSLTFDVDSVAATAIGSHSIRTIADVKDDVIVNRVSGADLTVSGSKGSAAVAVDAGASAKTVSAAVNATSASTGVEATAVTKAKLFGASATGNYSFTVNTVSIGTVNISDTTDLRGIRDAINNISGRTGVSAVMGANNSEIILTDADGDDIDMDNFSGPSGSAYLRLDALNMDGTTDGTSKTSATVEFAGDDTENAATATITLTAEGEDTITITGVDTGDASDGQIAADVKTVFDALVDQGGYSIAISDDILTFSRNDGKTFAVTAEVLTDTATNANEVTVTIGDTKDGTTVSSSAGTDATGAVSLTVSNAAVFDATGSADAVVSGQVEFTSGNAFTVAQASNSYDGSVHLGSASNSSSLSSVADANLTTATGAFAAIKAIDGALEKINAERADLGAISNRLDNTINNLSNIKVNIESSQSRIQDADFAAETSNLTKAQILSQAATAMLAQANASKQSVLSLLQG